LKESGHCLYHCHVGFQQQESLKHIATKYIVPSKARVPHQRGIAARRKDRQKHRQKQNKECVKPNHFTFRAGLAGEMSRQEALKIVKDVVIRFQHKFSSQNLCKTPWHELSLIVQESF